MTKTLLAIAALAALAQPAHAAGFVTDGFSLDLYGIIDAGYGHLEHSYAGSSSSFSTVNPYNLNSSHASFDGVFSGGMSMSRWGIKGAAELGQGRKAGFVLESALNAASGQTGNASTSIADNVTELRTANSASALNGQLFSRGAYVYVSDPTYGSLQLGRTTNFSLDQTGQYDPVQAAMLFSPLGYSGGIGGGLGATENTRLDNSVKYQGKFDGVDVGVQYKHGGGADAQTAGTAYVGMLGYSIGALKVEGTYARTQNSVVWGTGYSNVVAPTSSLTIEDTSGFMLSGLYRITPQATAKFGYEYTKVTAPTNTNLTDIQTYYGMTMADLATNASGKTATSTAWFGGDYKVTEALDVSAGYYDVNTTTDPEAGKQYRTNVGSLLVDYTVNRYFDTYAGAMFLHYSGAGLDKKAPVDAYANNAMVGAGMRFKF
jgi:GBP family porin